MRAAYQISLCLTAGLSALVQLAFVPGLGAQTLAQSESSLTLPPAAQGDPYAQALAESTAAEARGDLAAASKALESILYVYSEDSAVALRLAWLQFRSGQFLSAAGSYQLALSRGDQSGDAALGLGWSLQRQGLCALARAQFEAAAQLLADKTSAQQGLALCPAAKALVITPALTQGLFIYQDHPLRNYASATTARLSLLLHDRFLLSAAYRYSYFGSALADISPWHQQDVHLSLGFGRPLGGASVSYAMITGSAGSYTGTSHHLGAAARVALLGSLMFSGAVSLYSDATVARGELAWQVRLPYGLSIKPAAALQWSQSEWRPSGALTVAYDHPKFGVFVGGKYGEEWRPAMLDFSAVYIGDERIPFGLWTGASLIPIPSLRLSLTFAYDRLRRADSVATFTAAAYYLTLGISKDF